MRKVDTAADMVVLVEDMLAVTEDMLEDSMGEDGITPDIGTMQPMATTQHLHPTDGMA